VRDANHRARSRRLLTAADEAGLASRIALGDRTARDELIERNLPLVHWLAGRHRGRGVPFEDLVQEGTVGLARAVDGFDHRRGLKFSTYAVWWIRRALLDALDDRAIRIPAAARRQMAAIRRAEDELGPGRATAGAIAQRTGLSARTVQALRSAPRVSASLDQPVGDDATPLHELIADGDGPDASQRAEDRETVRRLWAMLRLLPERHREVLVRRYGLRAGQAQTHKEIAVWLGVGEERSRQLEHQALQRLRSLGARSQLAA